jgi:predicted nucleotide-binding protein
MGVSFTVWWMPESTKTSVRIKGPERGVIQRILNVFLEAEERSALPEPPPTPPISERSPVVFIGHGHSDDWRRIKDHLQDKHNYKVEAYEVGSRSGHTIRDVLDYMASRSTFAVLVMSAEDETSTGEVRARQNVVHEVGLFQGRLGFNRAIAVVENGVEVFSNLQGVDQIRYSSGQVETTLGDILATLRREFGDRR